MRALHYSSADGKFSVEVDEKNVSRMLNFCRTTHPNETGGLLLGRYSEDCRYAIVTHVEGPQSGSRHGRYSFFSALGSIQKLLDRLWERREAYYLGEWHSHPEGSPVPSLDDLSQMAKIARDVRCACPEPIMIIIGGDPRVLWNASVTVSFRTGSSMKLTETMARSAEHGS